MANGRQPLDMAFLADMDASLSILDEPGTGSSFPGMPMGQFGMNAPLEGGGEGGLERTAEQQKRINARRRRRGRRGPRMNAIDALRKRSDAHIAANDPRARMYDLAKKNAVYGAGVPDESLIPMGQLGMDLPAQGGVPAVGVPRDVFQSEEAKKYLIQWLQGQGKPVPPELLE